MSLAEPPIDGRRAQAKHRTRTDIVAASLDLFQRRGFDQVTTQEIADAVGVTQRTLFRHFPRKDLILYQTEYDYVARFEGFLDRSMLIWTDPYDAVKSAFQSLCRYYDDNRATISAIYAVIQGSDQLKAVERSHQTRIDYLVACALDGLADYQQRRNPPSLTSRLVAGVLFGTIRPMHRAWLRGELPGDLHTYAEIGWANVRPVYEAARTYGAVATAGFAQIVSD
jgi:AcrR family transcriptional regulator